ncbi:MAG: catecholate siderophore receptor Fiu [Proteobacteria bacterium]|nr:catecholate siderophore receptor Fiu [Pseudomonadota bacterium]
MAHIKSRKHALPVAVLTTGLTLALPAMAATGHDAGTTSSDDANQLGRVEVKGQRGIKRDELQSNKFTQPLQDTPQTVQIISSDLFNQQGATNLTEALRNSAGVGTFYAGENGSTSTGDTISMRGFDTSNSIFVDGVRDLGSVSRDVFNIEQVEVIKGPAGTDTGRAAPTGSINMVSKQAQMQNAVSGSVTVGSDGQKRVTTDWKQTLGADSALRLNLMWQDSDVPGRDHVNNSRFGIAPSLGFGLKGDTRVWINLLYVKQDNVPDGFVPTIGLPSWTPQTGLGQLAGHPVDPKNFYGTRADHDDSKTAMATLRVEHDFSDKVMLTNTTRWGRTSQDMLLTSYLVTGGTAANPMAGNVKWTDPADLSTYTLARSTPNFKDQDNRIFTDQLNLRADFATGQVKHYLTAGLEYTRETQVALGQATTNGSTWTPANLYDPDWNATDLTWAHNGADGRGKTTTTSAYLFDTLKFGEHFLLTGGVRADRYRTQYAASAVCSATRAPFCGTNPAGTVLPSVDASTSGTLLNWKLGAVYKFGETLSLYANSALSQQPPGGANFSLSAASNSADNPAMRPQKARTQEIGAKWSPLQQRLSLNAALFRTTVDNEINTQLLDDAGNPTQTGKKRIEGVELSAVGNINEHWQVSAGYTRLKTRVVEGAMTAQDGSANLTYTPDNAFSAWTTYRFDSGLTIGGGARHSGELHRGTDGAVGTPLYTQAWTVYDAVISQVVNPNLTLRLNAYNLGNKHYVAAINKSGYRYMPGAARTFLLSADFRF